MGRLKESDNRIDLICQHCRDGRIIPIKIRIIGNDETVQEYVVKGYKKLESGNYVHAYLCKIEVFGIERTVKIFYTSDEQIWRCTGER